MHKNVFLLHTITHTCFSSFISPTPPSLSLYLTLSLSHTHTHTHTHTHHLTTSLTLPRGTNEIPACLRGAVMYSAAHLQYLPSGPRLASI